MLGCKYCVVYRGVRGSDKRWQFETEDELFKHIEREHHIPVRRPDETREKAKIRHKRENPEVGGPNCKCPDCERGRKVHNEIAAATAS